jgi:hypothetical protein
MVDKGLVCSICNITVARPSHLERHRQSHLRRNERTLEQCRHCELSFSRRDVLLRHLRSTHRIAVGTVRPIRKSCTSCVQRKLRCDRSQPCQACVKAEFECTFVQREQRPTAVSSIDSDQRVLTNESNTSTSLIHPVVFDDATSPAAAGDNCNEGRNVSEPHQLALTRRRASSNAVSHRSGYPDGAFEEDATQLQATTSMVLNDSCTQQELSNHNIEIMSAMAEPCNAGTPTTFDQSETFIPWADSLNWLDFTLDNTWELCNDLHIRDTASSVTPPRADTGGGRDILACVQQPLARTQVWPFEDDLDEDLLPSTSQLVTQPCLDVETEFSKSVRTLLEHDVLPDVRHLTGRAILNAYIAAQTTVDAYFTRFHEILPLVHRPTCQVSGKPSVLVAALASIGAMSSLPERPRHDIRAFSRAYLSQTIKQVFRNHTQLTRTYID